VVYSSRINGQNYTFGVSGRLYKSNVLIYDHQTQSLWSQLKETAIAGPMVGNRLHKIPAKRIPWQQWRAQHPQTLVLSTATGYNRNYDVDPYEGYYRALGIMFPVGDVRTDLSPKEMVLGVAINGSAKAYPMSRLIGGSDAIVDRIGDQSIRIVMSAEGQGVEVQDDRSRPIPVIFAYWFAWQAFHPQTAVYSGAKQPN
jgi:hypothetical protein